MKILIANRGEVALRIIRTCKQIGLNTVAIYTEADALSLHVRAADETVKLPDGPLANNYLNIKLIVSKALELNVRGIHPGYGFLSECGDFARAIEEAGMVWVGPTSKNIEEFASKHVAKRLAISLNVPTLPSSPLLANVEEAKAQALVLGYPVMIKSSDAGGGIGMFKCEDEEELVVNYPIALHKSKEIFKSENIFLEKFLGSAHHIEIQVVGDGKGGAWAIGERECSAQRRNQKVIEESPSSYINQDTREQMMAAAVSLAKAVQYRSLGTVEFILDQKTHKFYFLEVNNRLQVEHPVTESTFGIDLVKLMLDLALGVPIDWDSISKLKQWGHAIEARVYAENPYKNFQPSTGRLSYVSFPEDPDVRVDTWVESDIIVSPHYDPLLAKIIVRGKTREEARLKLIKYLENTILEGVANNLEFLGRILSTNEFINGTLTTAFLNTFTWTTHAVEVQDSGLYSLIQDYPGRIGYWNVGIPPSGPMDELNFQIANSLVGNKLGDAGIEILLDGLSLKFYCPSLVAVTGASCDISVDSHYKKKASYEFASLGSPVKHNDYKPCYATIPVPAGGILTIRLNSTLGSRAYLAIAGGIQTHTYLGSRSTFATGKLGGLSGGPLVSGEVLPLARISHQLPDIRLEWPELAQPKLTNHWEIKAIGGPYGAPDYFHPDDIKTLWSHVYTVSHNANRLGIRLSGFTPKWARKDGGDAGFHPSNVHDYTYGIGCLNYSGSTPIILTCDGPSLGGFVCPLTIIETDFWKVGQLRPGDTLVFKEVSYEYALEAKRVRAEYLANFGEIGWDSLPEPEPIQPMSQNPVIYSIPKHDGRAQVDFRIVGDRYLMIDAVLKAFGLDNRFLIEFIMTELKKLVSFYKNLTLQDKGLQEFIPGVTSLLVKYDSFKIKASEIFNLVKDILGKAGHLFEELEISCREIHLPLAFRDKWSLDAIKRYQKTIRSGAPYLPDNCEFVRDINKIESLEDLAKTISETTYLVLGLGDVYLGAPCAVPLDPRQRILTTKYDPARTFTPEGAVGIGGIYMCIYGMESPGGYQLVGRSLPIWYSYNNTPWLLDFFDHVKFYLVSDDELVSIREKYRIGKFKPTIKKKTISLKEYKIFLEQNAESITAFQSEHSIDQLAQRVDWSSLKYAVNEEKHEEGDEEETEEEIHERLQALLLGDRSLQLIKSLAHGNLYEIVCKTGDVVKKGAVLLMIEVMKMTISITAPADGCVERILAKRGKVVLPGENLFLFRRTEN